MHLTPFFFLSVLTVGSPVILDRTSWISCPSCLLFSSTAWYGVPISSKTLFANRQYEHVVLEKMTTQLSFTVSFMKSVTPGVLDPEAPMMLRRLAGMRLAEVGAISLLVMWPSFSRGRKVIPLEATRTARKVRYMWDAEIFWVCGFCWRWSTVRQLFSV